MRRRLVGQPLQDFLRGFLGAVEERPAALRGAHAGRLVDEHNHFALAAFGARAAEVRPREQQGQEHDRRHAQGEQQPAPDLAAPRAVLEDQFQKAQRTNIHLPRARLEQQVDQDRHRHRGRGEQKTKMDETESGHSILPTAIRLIVMGSPREVVVQPAVERFVGRQRDALQFAGATFLV